MLHHSPRTTFNLPLFPALRQFLKIHKGKSTPVLVASIAYSIRKQTLQNVVSIEVSLTFPPCTIFEGHTSRLLPLLCVCKKLASNSQPRPNYLFIPRQLLDKQYYSALYKFYKILFVQSNSTTNIFQANEICLYKKLQIKH